MAKSCRDNLEIVVDSVLWARLTPDYKMGCKRLVIFDRFYLAIQEISQISVVWRKAVAVS